MEKSLPGPISSAGRRLNTNSPQTGWRIHTISDRPICIMHLVPRILRHVTVLFILGAQYSANAACDQHVVMSADAKYLVLDSTTLEVNDVGNLWWLGIRRIESVVPHSTKFNAALWVSQLLNADGELLNSSRDPLLVVLQNLGRATKPGGVPPIIREKWVNKGWWVPNLKESRLMVFGAMGDEYAIGVFDSADDDLQIYATDDPTIGFGMTCVLPTGDLMNFGLTNKFTFEGTRVQEAKIVSEFASSNYRMTGVQNGCTGLMANFETQNPANTGTDAKVDIAVVDASADAVISEFETKRFVENFLFDRGRKILQHDQNVQAARHGGITSDPSNRLRVIDATTGNTVLARELPFSGQVQLASCQDGDKQFATIRAGSILHLIDTTDLSVVASRAVPFTDYYLF
jgi:hypothetical protein